MEMYTDRIPPYSEEAEQAVLGAILIDPAVIDKVSERLKVVDFYRQPHQRLFQVISELREAKQPIDLVTLTAELQARKMLDEVGGVPYLNLLLNGVPTTANVEYYARIVQEKAIRRHLIRQASQMAAQAYEAENIEEVMTSAQEQMQNIQDWAATTKNRILDIKELAMGAYARIEERAMNPAGISGIPTGYPDVDRLLNGLNKSDLIILAARPSMGKTAFALNIAQNVAVRAKKTAVIFNLEMPAHQLMERMFSAEGNIDSHNIRTGQMKQEDWERLTMAISTISEAPIKIIDEAFTISQIRSDARKLKRELGELGVIVVDYLQLISVEGNFGTNNERVSHISRALKLLARELDVPVIAIAQLNRAVEQRENKRPMMSDLRDSGAIEQDADVIMFLHRDDYYDPDSEKKNIAELIISKHRNGPVGKVELIFLKNYSKFLSLETRAKVVQK
jgi:replicative DNA helicase